MELTTFQPKTAPSLFLPLRETVLVPIGDIQTGAPGADLDRLQRHVDWARKTFPENGYFINMGDNIDIASPSNRRALWSIKGDLYDSVRQMMDEGVEKHIKTLKGILGGTKGRWLGFLRGHHQWPFEDGSTADSRLASFLEAPFLGNCSLVHLIFKDRVRHQNIVGKIWAHHGEGAGATLEAAIRKVRTNVVPYWFANVYIIAHFHQKAAVPIPWIDTVIPMRGSEVGEPHWYTVSRYIVAAGSFLKAFEVGSRDASGLPAGSYVEQKMLPPNTLGGPIIFIRPRRVRGAVDRTLIDVNVSV